MNRTKLFIENFFAYGFINILDKIIPVLLLPVITRLLVNPSDFGVYDMYNLIVGFGSPLAMLGMYDAMFREYFEKDSQQYRYNVTSTANHIIMITSSITCLILIIFNTLFSKLFFGESSYGTIVILSAISLLISNNSTIIAAPTRIQNQRKVYVITGLFRSLSYYGIAIILIYFGYSYFGMIFGNLISSLLLIAYFWMLNRKFFTKGKFDKTIAKELLKIGIPLLPTFLIYWIYNSMDKVMITNMIGTEQLGIYSIGARVASVSQFIYMAFAGGWSYFAFSTMKDDDQVELTSKVFEYLGAISFLSLIIIYPFIKPVFELIFPMTYSMGQVVVPYLYLSPLLLMLFQVIGNQFIVIKKSYWSTISLTAGAVINVALNYILINCLGVEGAAISTLIGYVVTVIMVCFIAKKMKLILISLRFITVSFVTTLYLFIVKLLVVDKLLLQILVTLISSCIILIIYNKELRIIIDKIKYQKK